MGTLTARPPAHAQEILPHTSIYSDLHAALNAAEQYTTQTGNIAVLIGYGEFPGGPGSEAIGNKFVDALEAKGEKSIYFPYDVGVPGANVAYVIPDYSDNGIIILGSYNIPEGAKRMNEVVQTKIGGERLFGHID